MSRVYLIRHGRPAFTWGDAGADPDPGLDETGHAQALAAADVLLALPPGERPTWVLTSPLRRCRETAAPLARTLGVAALVEPAVAEVPTPAHLSPDERGPWLRRAFAGRWDEMSGELDYGAWRDAVAAAVARSGNAAVFTHFVAINAAVSAATGDPRVLSFQPDHASITVLEVGEGDRLTLVERGREATTRVL